MTSPQVASLKSEEGAGEGEGEKWGVVGSGGLGQ